MDLNAIYYDRKRFNFKSRGRDEKRKLLLKVEREDRYKKDLYLYYVKLRHRFVDYTKRKSKTL